MTPGDEAHLPLGEVLRRRIQSDGPLPFRDWMEACLYDPQNGYYMRRSPIGTDAGSDFATSPTLHPFFGRAVAEEIHSTYLDAGRPQRFTVVEFGGGTGRLAQGALHAIDRSDDPLREAIQWVHVETSPAHRQQQASDDQRIDHHDEMPDVEDGMVVANEFIDALPVHWLQWQDGWKEVHVDWDGSRFIEHLGQADPMAIKVAPDHPLQDGQRIVASPAAKQWIDTLTRRLRGGRILIVDYGGRSPALWDQSRDGSVRGYKDHRLVEDVLREPGQIDITASVDFAALAQWAKQNGWQEEQYGTQEEFLLDHGILEALNQEDRDTVDGASRYLRLRQLLLPTGLGTAFKVQSLAPKSES